MRLFVIAGEPSGDALGGALMAGLSRLAPQPPAFAGVGGARMQAEGLSSLFDMSELSVMGLAEVLPKYLHLKRRIQETADAVLADPPDALITIDSPDFTLRVARLVKAARPDIPTIHYVAPSVWAWRAGRAAKMARVIDHVLALLPFEPPLMTAEGMGCDFVGHPIVAEPQATAAEAAAFRQKHDIAANAPLILALPGSRRGEVLRLGEAFGKSLQKVHEHSPELRVVLAVAPSVADEVERVIYHWRVPPILVNPQKDGEAAKRAAFAAANVALAASGTVSLDLAACATPMVIAYDMNWLSRQIIARMLKVDTVTLVNLISETRAVPEFLGAECLPERIAPALIALLNDPGDQPRAMADTMTRLGRGGPPPGERAAKAVLEVLARRPQT